MVVRVLQVGAHEDLMMNYYRHFGPRSVKFDYVLRRGGRPFRYGDDPDFDGDLYSITPLSSSRWRWMRELRALVRSGDYTHVHLHVGWSNALALLALMGLPGSRISHAHNRYPEPNTWVKARNGLMRATIRRLSDVRLACSSEAGHQMFGTDFVVLPNAIEYGRFRPDEEAREGARAELGVAPADFVVGHVGQFIPAKNHVFLVEIAAYLVSQGVPVLLLLVGSGEETLREVVRKADELGVRERLLLVGETHDVPRLLNAMDLFVFPSLFEGFGMALLEAQVNGLRCIYADTLPAAAVVSDGVIPLSLSAGVEAWSTRIAALMRESDGPAQRRKRSFAVSMAFDAASCAPLLEAIYAESATQ